MANQHRSNKAHILDTLRAARAYLNDVRALREAGAIGYAALSLRHARHALIDAQRMMLAAPASTRRRWRAGK